MSGEGAIGQRVRAGRFRDGDNTGRAETQSSAFIPESKD